MKRLMILAAVLALHAHADVIDVTVSNVPDGQYFSLVGEFTTSGDTVTSFTGTFGDDFELFQPVSLVPVGVDMTGEFIYDDLFVNGAFDDDGVLLNAGESAVNLFDLVGFDDHNGFFEQTNVLEAFSVVSVSAVDEPACWLTLVLAGLWLMFRREKATRRWLVD